MREEALAAEEEYIARATHRSLYAMSQLVFEGAPASGKDFRKLYSDKLVDKRGSGRFYYNKLRSAAGRCPLCMQREVAALDHYLPKESFPILAVTPVNLVPICSACNSLKLNKVSSSPEQLPLHPYFDQLPMSTWLAAEVMAEVAAPTRFRVERHDSWSEVTYRRVLNHFNGLKLGELYATEAATLLGNYSQLLIEENERGGSGGVRELLTETAASYRAHGAEPWSALALDTWAQSDWFCECRWGL